MASVRIRTGNAFVKIFMFVILIGGKTRFKKIIEKEFR